MIPEPWPFVWKSATPPTTSRSVSDGFSGALPVAHAYDFKVESETERPGKQRKTG